MSEKVKKTAEALIKATKDLEGRNDAKEKRSKELTLLNKDLSMQNKKIEKRSKELLITNKKLDKENQEIEYFINHDFLTNLYSRHYFCQHLRKINTPKNFPLGVMMIDINGLKLINDAFGQSIGDQVLIRIGEILEKNIQDNGIVARIGGDEFSILIPNTSLPKLQKIKKSLKNTISLEKTSNVELSIAIGFVLIAKKITNFDDVLMDVENDMYSHKTTISSNARNKAINAILKTLTEKYDAERLHSVEVSNLCKKIGEAMKADADVIKELELAGLFHDIGKISIPDAILNKPGKLTSKEYEIIKTHTEVGFQILRAADEYSDLAVNALYHHERWDGQGYPKGIKGKEIPLFSRIIGIADAFEAMTAERPYHQKHSIEDAAKEIVKFSGQQFDPQIAKLFVEEVLGLSWKSLELG